MKQNLLMFMVNNLVVYEVVKCVVGLAKSRLWRTGLFGMLSMLLLLGNMKLQQQGTKPSHFAFLEVPRLFSSKELKNSYKQKIVQLHPDKNQDDPEAQEKFIRLKEVFQILNDDRTRLIYDRFGQLELTTKKSEYARQETEYYHLAMAEGVITYLVYLVFVLLLTYEQSLKACRWVLLVLTALFWAHELQALNTSSLQPDLLDQYLEGYALFERVAMGRLLSGVVICIVRCGYKIFRDSLLSSILEKMDCIIDNQKQIGKNMNFDESTVRQLMEKNLKEINQLSQDIVDKIEKELQRRKESRRASRLAKVFQLILVVAIIVIVVKYFDLADLLKK